MLETLITSKTRIKLLLKFFLNSNNTAYLRGLAEEFGESTNAIRLELNRFEDSKLLISKSEGNKKVFQANRSHPLFADLQRILFKYVGIDKIIDQVLEKIGDLQRVYLVGSYSKGAESGIIDLVFIGDINRAYLVKLLDKAEQNIDRKIRYVIYEEVEKADILDGLLLWDNVNGKASEYN